MPNLLDQSFFVGDISIPNTNNDQVLERLAAFIDKYEPECLLRLFGYPLHKAYIAAPSSQRMVDLKDGKEYTGVNGELRKTGKLTDILAPYVYYKFQESSATQTTGINTSIAKADNSIAVSPADKIVNAWNGMVDSVDNLYSFLRMENYSTTPVYPEFNYSLLVYGKRYFRRNNILGI